MLKREEWPEGSLGYLDNALVEEMIDLRSVSGVPVVPSPLFAAHVRFEDGSSRHAVGADGTTRKADGTDLFVVRNADAAQLYRIACARSGLGGIGVYFDTILNGEKRVMFHFDRRAARLLWVCPSRDRNTERRDYVYYRDTNPSVYLDILSAEFERLKHG